MNIKSSARKYNAVKIEYPHYIKSQLTKNKKGPRQLERNKSEQSKSKCIKYMSLLKKQL